MSGKNESYPYRVGVDRSIWVDALEHMRRRGTGGFVFGVSASAPCCDFKDPLEAMFLMQKFPGKTTRQW